jgi:hypothetical protein
VETHLRAGQPAVLQVGLHTSPRRQAVHFILILAPSRAAG